MAKGGAVIGSAYLEVIPKMSLNPLKKASLTAGAAAGKSFDKSFGDGLSGIGGTVSKALGGVAKVASAGAAAATTAIMAIGKQSFDAYAQYEQLSGGIKKLYGEAAATVEENASKAYQTAGMSANEYMEQVSGFSAALSQSLGGDTAKAAEQADKAMRSMSDNVSTFGTNMGDVENAYQGFAKQNYTMLDNLKLGYGGTKSEMERLIADANEWGAANGQASDLSIDSFSDVVTAIDQIQQKQQIAGTTAKEAGTTIEGSISAAKGAWSNLLTEFGKSDGDIDGAMDALVTTLVGDGTEGNAGVFGNVIPRIGTIVRNAVQQIPTIIATVAPQIGTALLTVFDAATGGLGTQILTVLQPVTDALAGVFGSIGGWVSANQPQIDGLVDAFGRFAETVSGAVGGAIETVAPIIGDLASAALPALTVALDFASGAIQCICDFFSNMADAISPVTDALAPVVEAIGTALVDALSWAADAMSDADFSTFAGIVKDALGGIVGFIEDVVSGISDFFGAVADFMEDPIGSIQGGFAAIVGSGEAAEGGVSTSFANMDANVAGSLSGVGKSIDTINGKQVKSKKATATVTGNAVNGKAADGVGETDDAIEGLESKSVDASVTGNAKDSSTASNIWDTVSAIGSLVGKSVDVVTNYITKGSHASGGIRYHAQGFIANKYGSGVLLGARDYVGEDGAEAIIPLTNKRYTRPFADTVAEQMLSRMGPQVPSMTFNITADNPEAAASAIERRLSLLGLV